LPNGTFGKDYPESRRRTTRRIEQLRHFGEVTEAEGAALEMAAEQFHLS
jgi:hypothetical protein